MSDVGDIDARTVALFEEVRPFTLTGIERMSALRESVRHIVRAAIPGAIVECGVWRGGSMMAVARTLLELRHARDLYLFDTFEGMTAPTSFDADLHGTPASVLLETDPAALAIAPLDEVRQNLMSTGYDMSRVSFVRGRVEDTLPGQAPGQIALLRLDTDWYESTRHELIHLYPRLAVGGILIIDDYGHFTGARKATDEYFQDAPVFLNRIDYTARLVVKT